jgi:hypothetical protein
MSKKSVVFFAHSNLMKSRLNKRLVEEEKAQEYITFIKGK